MLAWFIYGWLNWNTIVEMNFNALDQKLRFKNFIFINDFRKTSFLTNQLQFLQHTREFNNIHIQKLETFWKCLVFQGWKSDSVFSKSLNYTGTLL